MNFGEATRVFISQPMSDRTAEEIRYERDKAIEYAKKELGDNIFIVDSYFEGATHETKPLWFLGKSLELLSTADVAIFVGDFMNYRGCKFEHLAAIEYGIDKILYWPTNDHIYDINRYNYSC